jgi:hypothetical protein
MRLIINISDTDTFIRHKIPADLIFRATCIIEKLLLDKILESLVSLLDQGVFA